MLVDGILDTPLLVIRGTVKVGFKATGDIYGRIIETTKKQSFDLIVVNSNSQLPVQFARHLNDLSGIAHGITCLYGVVLEGRQDLELKLKDKQIDQLLQSPTSICSRDTATASFYLQRNYSDSSFLDLVGAKGVVA